MKAYSTKANARRAARQHLGEDAVEDQDFELIEEDGQFGYRDLTGIATGDGQDSEQAVTAAQEQGQPTEKKSKPRSKSSVASPVQQVWAIANSMPEAKRKEIISACVEQGIAFFTARTQYQRWKSFAKK